MFFAWARRVRKRSCHATLQNKYDDLMWTTFDSIIFEMLIWLRKFLDVLKFLTKLKVQKFKLSPQKRISGLSSVQKPVKFISDVNQRKQKAKNNIELENNNSKTKQKSHRFFFYTKGNLEFALRFLNRQNNWNYKILHIHIFQVTYCECICQLVGRRYGKKIHYWC